MIAGLLLLVFLVVVELMLKQNKAKIQGGTSETAKSEFVWQIPDTASIPHNEDGDLIRYGRNLIANTALHLGPKGLVANITNGMNCQNCHIDAGLKPFGNCFSAVASTYPKYRPRSGRVESIEFRINECLERSLNGSKIDSLSREMRAMVAYMKWLGDGVPKDVKPKGSGLEELKYLDRAADTSKGRLVYLSKCQSCHGPEGKGLMFPDSSGFVYPPLWGDKSYNVSAGLFRLTRFASYIRDNMPFGASHNAQQLSVEESWDVAAFVNSQPRPDKRFSYDWPDIKTKPEDYPFGPYADGFTEVQHKYGPFGPIRKAKEEMKKNKAM